MHVLVLNCYSHVCTSIYVICIVKCRSTAYGRGKLASRNRYSIFPMLIECNLPRVILKMRSAVRTVPIPHRATSYELHAFAIGAFLRDINPRRKWDEPQTPQTRIFKKLAPPLVHCAAAYRIQMMHIKVGLFHVPRQRADDVCGSPS